MLAKDEMWHYQIMQDIIAHHPSIDIQIDDGRQKELLDQITIPLERLKAGQLSRTDLLSHLIDTEYSEWNDVFLFAVSSMNSKQPEFKSVASQLQNHLDKIEQHIMTITDDSVILEKLFAVKRIWNKRILIVDDDDMIRRLLARIFGKRFHVDEVKDGREALTAIRSQFYDVILSDVNMPMMDGWALYEELTKQSFDFTRKFIFLTGDRKHEDLFMERSIKYFFKPFPLDEMIRAVDQIVLDSVPANTASSNRI